MFEPTLRRDTGAPGANGGRRLAFECRHGATSAVVLPGTGTLTDLTVLDILLARHHGARKCDCAPDPRRAPVAPARA